VELDYIDFLDPQSKESGVSIVVRGFVNKVMLDSGANVIMFSEELVTRLVLSIPWVFTAKAVQDFLWWSKSQCLWECRFSCTDRS
jgi:hypothetical protein